MRQLIHQFLRHLFPSSFVLRVALMSEGLFLGVKNGDEIVRFLCLKKSENLINKAEQGTGMQTVTGDQRIADESKMRPV